MKRFKRLLLILPVVFLMLTCAKDEDPEKFILSVTITPEEGGTVSPDGGVFDEGTSITLTATAATGYVFKEWMGDLQSTVNPVSASMDADMNITLVFVQSDADGDGVADDADTCPDTPEGEDVDSNGCSDTQKDTDGDGVTDDMDVCPNTPEGEAVNEQGCPLTSPIYLDENGITIKAYEWAQVGQSGEISGVVYTVVDESMLREMVQNEEDVTRVCTTKVTDMSGLFAESTFNEDIGSWDVSNVTDMNSMFRGYSFDGIFIRTPFNQDIGSWDVSSVTDMGEMFRVSQFNQPINTWDVSSVTDMGGMFFISRFNQPIGNWDVSNVTNMAGMFIYGYFDQPIGNWDVSHVTDMSYMFKGMAFNQDISTWDVSHVTDMTSMLESAVAFNQNLSGWEVSNVVACERFSYGTYQWKLPKPNFTNCNSN